jgi:diaminopimelate decarboxylase
MTVFQHQQQILEVESVPIPDIVAAVGSPVYVYSTRHFVDRYQALSKALSGLQSAGSDVQICYAVKANSNLAVLHCFHELGAGFDIVSGGELQRVLTAGGDPAKVIFSGVGKSTADIDLALKLDIHCFNVESAAELDRLANRARLLGRTARIAVRVNPDVDAKTHPYISTGLKENKFGVPAGLAIEMYEQASASAWLEPIGIACHIGSQIEHPEPMLEALTSLLELVDALAERGLNLSHVDLGGGFGVTYENEKDFDVADYGARVGAALQGRKLSLSIEPGRYLVANGGILVTRVEYLKRGYESDHRNFAVVDAAMNDLIRPALYQAWHRVEAVCNDKDRPEVISADWDIVGPVCESGDFLAKQRHLSIAPGDLLAVHSAGAYAMVQSSNYNSRPRPAEVLVDGSDFRVIRRRETSEDLYRHELLNS